MLSVIMASYNSRATIRRALASLADQHDAPPMEVIVVDSSPDDAAAAAAEWPAVRLLRHPKRLFAGEARNLGAAEARGDILAFVDADATMPSDWAAGVVRAHATLPHAVIGGVVENGNPSSYAGWAYYFSEFTPWLPGTPAGFVDEVPGLTMTIKRAAFERFGPFLTGAYCSDTDFQWRLAAHGIRPYLEPAIRVAHLNPVRLRPILQHEPRHGRDFARLRCRAAPGRLAATGRALSAPLLPLVLMARAGRRVFRHSSYGGRFLVAAPLTAAALVAWSLGEFSGYVEGAIAPATRPAGSR